MPTNFSSCMMLSNSSSSHGITRKVLVDQGHMPRLNVAMIGWLRQISTVWWPNNWLLCRLQAIGNVISAIILYFSADYGLLRMLLLIWEKMTRIRECPVAVKWCFGGPCRFLGVINTRYWPHITGDLTGIVYLVVTLSLNKVAIRLVLPWVMFISIDDPIRQTAPYQHRFMAVLYTIGLCEFPFILGYCAVSLAYIYAIRVAICRVPIWLESQWKSGR